MDELVVDDRDGVRTITIDRPEVKNALTAAMRARFCELIEDADADGSLRAVVVTAVDPGFTPGVDFKEAAAASGTARPRPGSARCSASTAAATGSRWPARSGWKRRTLRPRGWTRRRSVQPVPPRRRGSDERRIDPRPGDRRRDRVHPRRGLLPG